MPKAGADPVGKVYIYNNTTIELAVTLNGPPLASKVPAGTPSSTEAFKFGTLAVERINSKTTDEAFFAEENTMRIRYSGYSLDFTVNIPRRNFPIKDYLQMVVNADGYVLTYNGVLIDYKYLTAVQRVETRGANKKK